MAWTERYMDAASTGGDGTTSATSGATAAWADFGAAITGIGVGPASSPTRINIKAGTYANTTTGRTFNTAGATTAPVWWRGYKTTVGDQDSNNVAVAGTDIPLVTFTTGQMLISGAHQIFSNIAITSACVTANGAVSPTASCIKLYRLRVENTAANAAARAIGLTSGATNFLAAACYLKTTSSAHILSTSSGASCTVLGTILTGGLNGVVVGASSWLLRACIFDSQAGDAISASSNGWIDGCAIYAPTGNGVNATAAIFLTVANSYFENVNQAAKAAINNTSGTNTNLIHCIGNAYYNCTANTSGLGDSPLIFDNGTLGSAGFNNPGSQDFSLASVAKALGFPGLFENTSVYQGYLDPGAVQRQEPSASPVVIRPFPGLGALLTI